VLALRPKPAREPSVFIAKWKPLYPSAVTCIEDNLDALRDYFSAPDPRPRHANLLCRRYGW
jgi:hypothetical protein